MAVLFTEKGKNKVVSESGVWMNPFKQKNQKLHFGSVEFELSMGHPRKWNKMLDV